MKYFAYFSLMLTALWSSVVFADNSRYVILVDAGSTGSKLHVYQVDASAVIPTIADVFSDNVTPGLSSFVDHPEQAGSSLKEALNKAVKFFDKNGINPNQVPINILATAGMRLIPQDKQQAIYDNVTATIQQNYAFALGDIKTISGTTEGLYDWLDVNYLLGNFQNHQNTTGSIDMGGASTQIAFATTDTSKPDNEVFIHINDQNYTVFTISFLGLGQDQARDQLLSDAGAANCYPSGYSFNPSSLGNFNFAACGAIYDGIIQNHQVSQQMISTQGQSFVAYSGIYRSFSFFNADRTPDQSILESHIQTVCSETWDQLQKDYPDVPAKYLSTYCANGSYHDQLIFNRYGIGGSQLTVADKINNKDIDWTLGAVLYSLIKSPSNYPGLSRN